MDHVPSFTNLIYEYFVLRFYFQYYKNGDTLPTIDKLCQKFNLSSKTVKHALRRMRSEGYISMGNGKYSKVLFQQTEEEYLKYVRRFFTERRKALTDLYLSTEKIFIPLLTESLCRMDEKELQTLSRLADHSGADDLMEFYCFTLQKLNNPLVMNLFWETSLFQGNPFMREDSDPAVYRIALIRQALKTFISYGQIRDREALYSALLKFQQSIVARVAVYIDHHAESGESNSEVSFTWRIYRDRPQICSRLATCILHQIHTGVYQNNEYLPSYEKLAEEYGVSVSTMRRTIHILREKGVALPVNGVGIRVASTLEDCDKTNFENPAIRCNLSYFMQAYEIVIYTCEEVACFVLPALSPEQKKRLICQLQTYVETDRCELSLHLLLIYLSKYSSLKGIQEIYEKIYYLFLWGYPLNKPQIFDLKENQELLYFTQKIIKCLTKEDYSQCALMIREMARYGFPIAERYLFTHGIRPEELRLTPSVRLLVAED